MWNRVNESKRKFARLLKITLPFVLGLAAGVTFSAGAAEKRSIDDLVFGRAEGVLASLHNVIISLSVDTERAAININEVNKRVSKLERRLKKLEDNVAKN